MIYILAHNYIHVTFYICGSVDSYMYKRLFVYVRMHVCMLYMNVCIKLSVSEREELRIQCLPGNVPSSALGHSSGSEKQTGIENAYTPMKGPDHSVLERSNPTVSLMGFLKD